MTSVTVPIDTNPFPFRWGVEVLGYEWVRGHDSEWHLTARASRMQNTGLRVYDPLKDNRLFLKFSAVQTSRGAILKFANRYGDLFNSYNLKDMVVRPTGQYWPSQLRGASLNRWKLEINQMRVLVRIWRAIKGARKNELKHFIFWRDKNAVEYRLGMSIVWLATPEINNYLLKLFTPGDVLKPAMYLLQREINRRIAEADNSGYVPIVPRLVWCPGPRKEGIARPDHHQRIIFHPTNLLAAMWLQFARAITEEYRLQICEGCGEYFQIGKGARRIHTQTCSDRCRQRLSRRLRGEN